MKGFNLLILLLLCTFTSIVGGKPEVQCTSELLQLVGEEVTECVARQQQIAREVGEVFSGEVYRQASLSKLLTNIFILFDPLGISLCDDI